MRSIQEKLVIIYLAVVLLVMVISGVFIIMRLQEYEYNKIEEEIKETSDQILSIIGEDEEIENLKDTLEESVSFFQKGKRHVYILDTDGNVILSAGEEKEKFSTSSVIAAKMGEVSFEKLEITDDYGYDKKFLEYAKPIKLKEEYILYIRISTDFIFEKLKETRKIIIYSVGIALVVTVIIGSGFATTLTGPIKALTKKAKQMAEGNLKELIEVKSDDEIGQLTKTFNYMAGELNKTLQEISSEKSKLETVLENMEDGIVTFDNNGNILHNNRAIYKILETKNIPTDFNSFFKRLKINIKLAEIIRNRSRDSIIQQLELIGGKFFNLQFVRYFNRSGRVQGVIVVFRDITKQAKLEEMRKGFIADVSHEMRTPLTTIKGSTETLVEGAIEDKEAAAFFLGKIVNEVDRMERLVEDLLDLSKLESKQFSMKFGKLDVVKILAHEVDSKRVLAKKKNQVVNFDSKEVLEINADKARMLQVFSNIIGNAIKYGPEETVIDIEVKEDNKFVKIIIHDNGIGISKEDLPRIFERFYRVDKARSRSLKGTGLGLAITKKIIDLHNGQVSVESNVGEGTTFYLSFPKYSNEKVNPV